MIDLLKYDEWPYPTTVQLLGSDDGVEHVVTIVGRWTSTPQRCTRCRSRASCWTTVARARRDVCPLPESSAQYACVPPAIAYLE